MLVVGDVLLLLLASGGGVEGGGGGSSFDVFSFGRCLLLFRTRSCSSWEEMPGKKSRLLSRCWRYGDGRKMVDKRRWYVAFARQVLEKATYLVHIMSRYGIWFKGLSG